ncbi:hypothetical protein ACFSL6_22955 [Paenibacillus thailandensis]|uniref:Uncharacterized protein n=1 Tax=Paenibacillus thailandensis TaxID=393250 RepID=A0ABW5R278_9BACL
MLTTQYLEEADRLADRIAVIDKGIIVAEGTPSQLKSSIGGKTLTIRLSERADPGIINRLLADYRLTAFIANRIASFRVRNLYLLM